MTGTGRWRIYVDGYGEWMVKKVVDGCVGSERKGKLVMLEVVLTGYGGGER